MAGKIGIKVADGSFYPIVGENSSVGKKLVLTTVHDNQDSVQIDLYRSMSGSMRDSQYIGSLVVENIRPAAKGAPSISMSIASDADGYITAEAFDLDAGPGSDHHVLNVSLRTMDTVTSPDDFPDFDLGENDGRSTRILGRQKEDDDKNNKFPWVILAIAVLCVALGIAALWFFLFKDTLQDRTPVAETATEQPAQTESETVTETPPAQPVPPPPPPVEIDIPVIKAPQEAPPAPGPQAPRQRPPAPVTSYRVPAVIPANGVVYQIRWGDTLWDISAAFYRNPLLYPRIARYNNIRNPDRILAGFNIRIPPLN